MKPGSAKIGDLVRPYHIDKRLEAFEVKAIFEDNFGRVLLIEPGGFGYGEHYCSKVKRSNHENHNEKPSSQPAEKALDHPAGRATTC